MYTFFTFLRLLPFWAFPVGLILAEFAWHLRRRGNQFQYFFWAMSTLCFGFSVLWIIARGDLHAVEWGKWLFELG